MSIRPEDLDSRLRHLIAITERIPEVKKSNLERYFWVIVLIGLFGVPLLNNATLVVLSLFREQIPFIASTTILSVGEPRMISGTELCYGEYLEFEFDVNVHQSGIYDVWSTTWREEPPPITVVFTETDYFVSHGERTFTVHRKWKVPSKYINPFSNEAYPLLPGSYIRESGLTSEGNAINIQPLRLHFTIPEGCEVQNE